jgi:hypothetical protein
MLKKLRRLFRCCGFRQKTRADIRAERRGLLVEPPPLLEEPTISLDELEELERRQREVAEKETVQRGVTRLQALVRRQFALKAFADKKQEVQAAADAHWVEIHEQFEEEKRKRALAKLVLKQVCYFAHFCRL